MLTKEEIQEMNKRWMETYPEPQDPKIQRLARRLSKLIIEDIRWYDRLFARLHQILRGRDV